MVWPIHNSITSARLLPPLVTSTAIATSSRSTVIKAKPSDESGSSESATRSSSAALSSSSESAHSTKPYSFTNRPTSKIVYINTTSVVDSKTNKAPISTPQPNLPHDSPSSTFVGSPSKKSTSSANFHWSTSVAYTSTVTQGKPRFSFPKRPTSKATLRKPTSSVKSRPSTSVSPTTQSTSRYSTPKYSTKSSSSIPLGKPKFSFSGKPSYATTRTTSGRPSKNTSYGSDRPESRTKTAPYHVVPSVIKCRCQGDPKFDPPCCQAVYKTVTKIEPTTKPIIIPVPDPTTVYGGRLTLTKDVWKTITDPRTYTKEQWEVCKTTVVDYKTRTLCKAPEPTYDGPSHGINRPHKPDHGYQNGWNGPSDVSVPDACSPGYSCLPDLGYCRTRCSDYFQGCSEKQCRADFFQCYDDCLWKDDRGETYHSKHGEDDRPGRYPRPIAQCHNGCKALDQECHKNCNKGHQGHHLRALAATDTMDRYAHGELDPTLDCHKSCRPLQGKLKCHSDCNQYKLPGLKTPEPHQPTCAWGYSCQRIAKVMPHPYVPESPEFPEEYPAPSRPFHQSEPPQEYSPPPKPPGRVPHSISNSLPPPPAPPAPPGRQYQSPTQYPGPRPEPSVLQPAPVPPRPRPEPSQQYSSPPAPPGRLPESPNHYSPPSGSPATLKAEPTLQTPQPPSMEPSLPASAPSTNPGQAPPAPPAPPAAIPPYWCAGTAHTCHPRYGNSTIPATVIKSQGTAIQPVLTTVKERLRNMWTDSRSENLMLLKRFALQSFQMVYDVFLASVIAGFIATIMSIILLCLFGLAV